MNIHDKPTYEALKKRVQQLEQAETETFRFLTETLPFGIVMLSKDGTFKYINPQFNKMFGYDLSDIPDGRTWFKRAFPDPDKRHQAISAWLEDLTSSEIKQKKPRVFTVNCKNGSKKLVNFTLFQVETGENLIICEHITERGQVNEKYEQFKGQWDDPQNMASISLLAGGIAHHFNNILMGIQGSVSLMMMDKDIADPDYGHLKTIEECIKSAVKLTQSLLGFAQKGKYEIKTTDLNDLIKNENRIFSQTQEEVRIHGKYEKKLWTIEVDQNQIKQVFLNLYINALQAMPDGGNIYIRTENVTLTETYPKPLEITPGRYIKVTVTDTGIGMDKATLEKIFYPFFTTKNVTQNSGLGLASVYGIIKNHGGFIKVYSEKSAGTTFSIYLPAS